MSQFKIEWLDFFREPQCPPDDNFPTGKDLDCSLPRAPNCIATLPYPAKRCGMYIVECIKCEQRIACTTAGRADDPRSLRMSCAIQPVEE